MEKFKSRKFWMAVVGGVLVILNDGLGWNLPVDTVYGFAAIVIGWIVSEAYVDGKGAESQVYIIDEKE
jgi:uncharacterized membrane protein